MEYASGVDDERTFYDVAPSRQVLDLYETRSKAGNDNVTYQFSGVPYSASLGGLCFFKHSA
jgi:hypothetical protein